MSNRLALLIFAAVLAALAFDFATNDADGSLFLAKKAAELIEYMAFWR